MKWSEPALAEILGRHLDALGPFLKYFPDALGAVINKLFELLTSLPHALKVVLDLHCLFFGLLANVYMVPLGLF